MARNYKRTLRPAEIAILRLLERGYKVEPIAERLGMPYDTVKSNIRRTRVFLDAPTQGHAVLEALKQGYITSTHTAPLSISPRQLEAVQLLLTGLTEEQVAKRMWVNVGTVRKHIHGAYKRNDVHTLAELAGLLWHHDKVL